MGAILRAFWSRFYGAVIGAAAVLGLALAIFFKGKQAGREHAEAKQREANDEARKRMDAVKPADSGSTVDSLRKGTF